MGIKARFTMADITKETMKAKMTIERGIVRILQMAGESFVSDARQNLNITSAFPKGDYTNQTSNLRSSIGYFILKDGAVITSNLEGTAEGQSAAKAVLSQVNKSGYQLVGVAGMDYASAVEAMGYNVITSQKEVAIVRTREMLETYRARMAKKGTAVDFDMDNFVTTVMKHSA